METGLTTSQVLAKQKEFGKNEIESKESFSAIKLFLLQFPTLINGILAIGGLFSLLINEPLDAALIFIILFLNGVLGFVQEYRAQKALEKLKEISQPISVVLREGKAVEVKSSEIVPGDIVILNEGDRLPADGQIISHSHLEIDESVLTGESLPVIKKEKDEGFQGTFVQRGKGRMLVTKTGEQTQFGQIAKSLATVKEAQTPLQKQLNQLARLLSFSAIGVSLILLPLGLIHKDALYEIFLIIISISVAVIPESLPAVITICLSLGTNRMAGKKAIVRKLASIETVGAVQIVLTDKTGTLTKNDMSVKTFFARDQKMFHELVHAAVIGNTAFISNHGEEKKIIGDKTDAGALLWAMEQKKDFEDAKDVEVLDEYTFDPLTKTITTVAKLHDKPMVFVKGAPERILAISNLDAKEKKELTEKFENYAEKGLRVIAFSQKHDPLHKTKTRTQLESNLNFIGFLCLYDPPRTEARQSVLAAQNAGIRVIMVTGDNPLTAKQIAKEVGIVNGHKQVLTGKDMDRMTETELTQAIEGINVFARTTPEHKMRLVNLFQSQKFIVGVTGDGVNDALALKKADVGIAMGQKGTDVAREASDIVLADDNFATLVEAIKEGRKIYANILRIITYLLAGNLAELFFVVVGTFFNYTTPLLPAQILWINLVTDGLPALALANEKAEKGLLEEMPRKSEEQLITRPRMIFIVTVGTLVSIILLIIYAQLDHLIGIPKSRTISFNLLVIFQLVFAYIVRGKNSIWSNKFLMFTIVITVLLQIMITIMPLFQGIFHLTL